MIIISTLYLRYKGRSKDEILKDLPAQTPHSGAEQHSLSHPPSHPKVAAWETPGTVRGAAAVAASRSPTQPSPDILPPAPLSVPDPLSSLPRQQTSVAAWDSAAAKEAARDEATAAGTLEALNAAAAAAAGATVEGDHLSPGSVARIPAANAMAADHALRDSTPGDGTAADSQSLKPDGGRGGAGKQDGGEVTVEEAEDSGEKMDKGREGEREGGGGGRHTGAEPEVEDRRTGELEGQRNAHPGNSKGTKKKGKQQKKGGKRGKPSRRNEAPDGGDEGVTAAAAEEGDGDKGREGVEDGMGNREGRGRGSDKARDDERDGEEHRGEGLREEEAEVKGKAAKKQGDSPLQLSSTQKKTAHGSSLSSSQQQEKGGSQETRVQSSKGKASGAPFGDPLGKKGGRRRDQERMERERGEDGSVRGGGGLAGLRGGVSEGVVKESATAMEDDISTEKTRSKRRDGMIWGVHGKEGTAGGRQPGEEGKREERVEEVEGEGSCGATVAEKIASKW